MSTLRKGLTVALASYQFSSDVQLLATEGSARPMHRLEQHLDAFRASLRRPDSPVVLAVSGGADSVALLRAWRGTDRDGWGNATVAHFNHQWRGDESQGDEAFVGELARLGELPCEVGRPAPDSNGKTRGQGRESAARLERYAFFSQVASRVGARYLVTAHTADDQAETVLLRILRGTGVAGLAGIPRFRRIGEELTVVRPLLDIQRDQLRGYLADLGQAFREDSSNADEQFARNRVRRSLLPLLREQFSPGIDESLRKLAESARESQRGVGEIVDWLVADVILERPDARVAVDCSKLATVPPFIVRQLFVHLWTLQKWPARDMNRRRWSELADLVRQAGDRQDFAAPRMFPGGIRVEAAKGILTLGPVVLADGGTD